MMITPSDALSRLVRIGILSSIIGALHTLSLLFTWFTISYGIQTDQVNGYMLNESLIFSLVAGGLAGASSVIASLTRRLSLVKWTIPSLAAAAGALALLSPIYSYAVKMPRFNVFFIPEIGLFAAIFSGLAIAGMAALSFLIMLRVREERAVRPWSYPAYYQESAIQQFDEPSFEELPPMETEVYGVEQSERVTGQPTSRGVTYAPVASVPKDSQCNVCYEQLTLGIAVECTSCGALYHKDCLESWIDMGGKCTSCGAELSRPS